MALIHYDFSVELSAEQTRALKKIRSAIRNGQRDVTVGGLAGTGKTFLAANIARSLSVPADLVLYCAPTGKATRVLREKLRQAYVGDVGVRTIHSVLYFPNEVHCDQCPKGRWDATESTRCHDLGCEDCTIRWEQRDYLDQPAELVICDEASMVSERMFHDFRSHDLPIIWVGDHGQLPPVNSDFNLMEDPAIQLTKIHRQATGSPILRLARRARMEGKLPYGKFGPGVIKRKWDGSLAVDFDAHDLLLCGRNKTRVRLNQMIRAAHGFPAKQPVTGDRVICLRNNRGAGIVNGMLGRIRSCNVSIRRWGQPTAYHVAIDLDSGDFYSGLISSEQFNAEYTLSDLSGVDLWDYGYALTVHKAQGSEADHVVVIEESWPKQDHKRWLYTAVTRAKKSLEIIQ